MELTRLLGSVLLSFALISPAWASTLTIPSDRCAEMNALCIDEQWLTGTGTSTTAGEYGWTFAGGTLAQIASEAGHPGIFRRDTSSSINTFAYWSAGTTTGGPIQMGSSDQTRRFRLNQVDANTSVRIGFLNTFSGNPSAGHYLERLDGETNWFVVTRHAGVQTGSRTDTGVAAGTGWVDFRMVRVGSTSVSFYLNDVFIATHTTNITDTFCYFGGQIITSAASSKTIDLDRDKLWAATN